MVLEVRTNGVPGVRSTPTWGDNLALLCRVGRAHVLRKGRWDVRASHGGSRKVWSSRKSKNRVILTSEGTEVRMKAIRGQWAAWTVAVALWTGYSIAGPAPTRPPAWMRQHEVGVEGVVHAPGLGDFDVFDYAAGVELEYRYWWADVFGMGLGIGYERWEAGNGARNWMGRTDGELNVVPLSALAYLRLADWGVCQLTGYGGLEYAWTDSDLTLERSGQKDSVSVDDTLLVRFGLSTAWPITSVLQLTLGAGFQFPIMKANASSHGGPLQDLDLQSFFVGAGISLAF